MKRLYIGDNITEAGLIQSFLAQHDIDSQLRNEFTSSVMGDMPFVDSWPEVWVANDDEVRAQALMQSMQSVPKSDHDWRCSACEEKNPANFELCWQCNTANGA